jgi:hypothetical protein
VYHGAHTCAQQLRQELRQEPGHEHGAQEDQDQGASSLLALDTEGLRAGLLEPMTPYWCRRRRRLRRLLPAPLADGPRGRHRHGVRDPVRGAVHHQCNGALSMGPLCGQLDGGYLQTKHICAARTVACFTEFRH